MAETFCPHCMAEVPSDDTFCPVCGKELNLTAEGHQLPIGTVLQSKLGRYLFGKVKGGGGFGMTYVARELGSGRVVAVKEYFPTRCQLQRGEDLSVRPLPQMQAIYEQGMRSFLSEASMLQAVKEIPSIVHVLDFFEANNTAYMAMEYLDGHTLSDMMQTQSRFEPTMLLRKMLPLMRDLHTLHEAGVLHRDIAPDNIMLMPDSGLKLLDFGCARSMEDGKSMTVVLKPGFAPIEQYQTRGQGPFTDIYALCATIYYCLSGKVPPEAPARALAIKDGLEDPLIPLTELGVKVSAGQNALLLWGLAGKPSARPQTIDLLANDLEATLASKPVPTTITETETETESVPVSDDPAPDPEPVPAPIPQSQFSLENFFKEHWLGVLLAVIAAILLFLFFR